MGPPGETPRYIPVVTPKTGPSRGNPGELSLAGQPSGPLEGTPLRRPRGDHPEGTCLSGTVDGTPLR